MSTTVMSSSSLCVMLQELLNWGLTKRFPLPNYHGFQQPGWEWIEMRGLRRFLTREDFMTNHGGDLVDASRICFNEWKLMSTEADDEADSKTDAKFDKFCESYVHEEEDYDSSDHFEHEFWEDETLLKY